VKQSDLGEYEENAREMAKDTSIQGKTSTPPQTKSYGWQTPMPPPQISKSRRIKGFGKNVSQLSLGVYISHLNVSLFYKISQEVVSPINMSHLFMKD
jgi:hypothetical protein